jgi:alkylated DNA repair dioxygenase AlkB
VDTLTWQTSLLDSLIEADPGDGPSADPGFSSSRRRHLDESAWVDHAPGWLTGSDTLLQACVDVLPWAQRDERIQGELVPQPRLTARLHLGELPAELTLLDELGELLSVRYGVRFRTVGANLYRDGRDSVAWHADRERYHLEDPVVGILSTGAPRAFQLRPKSGGRSLSWQLGQGDLLVMGGSCQHEYEHCVPKCAAAPGPRLSVMFRHNLADWQELAD